MEGVTVIRPHYLAWGWENLETMLFVGGYNRARQQKSSSPLQDRSILNSSGWGTGSVSVCTSDRLKKSRKGRTGKCSAVFAFQVFSIAGTLAASMNRGRLIWYIAPRAPSNWQFRAASAWACSRNSEMSCFDVPPRPSRPFLNMEAMSPTEVQSPEPAVSLILTSNAGTEFQAPKE